MRYPAYACRYNTFCGVQKGSMSALDKMARRKPETAAGKSKTRSQSVNNRLIHI